MHSSSSSQTAQRVNAKGQRTVQKMAADMQRKRSSECPDGTLAPSDGQGVERAESPTPGLTQGTEPVGIPDLRHFLYKSKSSGLFTSPEIEAPYTSEEEQERLLGLYQYLHSRAHNASRPLKTIYYTGPNENLLAWVTGAFELYMCYSPLGTKASAVSAIHKLMRWIRKEEDRLFILTPLTY
ncbi:putative vacuolar fusion protein MON1 [Cricetulus griseus]|nr:putative vacuolar fusion protein MON1 [Cricetulus griseus]